MRKSNRNISVQIMTYDDKGDKVLASAVLHASSSTWAGSRPAARARPAAYLTGYLAGKRAAEKGIEEAVLDIGLREPAKGALVFAALKGMVDAGVEIPHGEEILPSEDRISREAHEGRTCEACSKRSRRRWRC